jgi:hypothetical protein
MYVYIQQVNQPPLPDVVPITCCIVAQGYVFISYEWSFTRMLLFICVWGGDREGDGKLNTSTPRVELARCFFPPHLTAFYRLHNFASNAIMIMNYEVQKTRGKLFEMLSQHLYGWVFAFHNIVRAHFVLVKILMTSPQCHISLSYK